MESYVYLAEARINALYGELGGVGRRAATTTEQFEVKHPSIKGQTMGIGEKSELTETVDVHMAEKLDFVLSNLKISEDITGDNLYIRGKFPMSWNAENQIKMGITSTFWVTSIDQIIGDPCSRSMLLLIGSAHNIIGNEGEKGKYRSTSYIDAFFSQYQNLLDEDKLEYCVHEHGHKASDDMELLTLIRKNYGDQQSCYPPAFYSKWGINRYIDELYENYDGNYCEYGFVAQTQYSKIMMDRNDGKFIRYVVAAPLAVWRTNLVGSRVVVMPDGRKKYVLTSDELCEHRRRNYYNLPALLAAAGMNQERALFVAKMNEIMEELGIKYSFWVTYKKTELDNKMKPLINQYFITP